MVSEISLRERSLVSLSFMACVTLDKTLFQQTACASAVPGASASEEYKLA